MSKLNIHIKDSSKKKILLQLLRELPFVEIEQDTPKRTKKRSLKDGVEDLFGIWKH